MVDLFTHKPLSLQLFLFVKSLDERQKTLLVFDHLPILVIYMDVICSRDENRFEFDPVILRVLT